MLLAEQPAILVISSRFPTALTKREFCGYIFLKKRLCKKAEKVWNQVITKKAPYKEA